MALVAIGPSALIDCDLFMYIYTIRDTIIILVVAYIGFRIVGMIKTSRLLVRH